MTFWPSREWRKISGTHSLSTRCVAKDPTRPLFTETVILQQTIQQRTIYDQNCKLIVSGRTKPTRREHI